MYLYWVIIYPLHTKFPFKTRAEADKFCDLACIYHPYEVDVIYPSSIR